MTTSKFKNSKKTPGKVITTKFKRYNALSKMSRAIMRYYTDSELLSVMLTRNNALRSAKT